MTPTISVVIPAKNEAETVGALVAQLRQALPQAEVIVVDDGSSDGTGAAASAAGARVIRHPASRGNGAAVKTGARHATGELLAFMDADGQHDADQLPALLAQIAAGYDMAVGARASGRSHGLRLMGPRVVDDEAVLRQPGEADGLTS